MALNLKELMNFVMPLVQNGKEEEAQNLLVQAGKRQPAAKAKSGEGGLLDTVSGLLGKNDGGLIGSLGNLLGNGDAGPLSGLASVFPSLLKLIQPEHIGVATRYLTELLNKGSKAPARKPAAKRTTAAAKKTTSARTAATAKKATATAKKTTAAAKRTTAAAKKTTATAKKATTARTAAAAKKATAAKKAAGPTSRASKS